MHRFFLALILLSIPLRPREEEKACAPWKRWRAALRNVLL